VQHRVGGAAHGDVQRHGVLEGLEADGARQHGGVVLLVVAAGQLDDAAAGALEQLLAVGVGGQQVPLPGSDRPSASVRQFIELAVNMPEQEPQVGQAERSTSATSASDRLVGGHHHRVDQVELLMRDRLASLGLAGLHRPAGHEHHRNVERMAAISMPGVILSQLEMHTIASAQWALTMYSTESAISSRRAANTACRHGPWRCRHPPRWC
jgi:hypothetical protein